MPAHVRIHVHACTIASSWQMRDLETGRAPAVLIANRYIASSDSRLIANVYCNC